MYINEWILTIGCIYICFSFSKLTQRIEDLEQDSIDIYNIFKNVGIIQKDNHEWMIGDKNNK